MICELRLVVVAVRVALSASRGSLASRFRRVRVLFPDIGRVPRFHEVAVERWVPVRPASSDGGLAVALVLYHLGDLAMI